MNPIHRVLILALYSRWAAQESVMNNASTESRPAPGLGIPNNSSTLNTRSTN